MKIRSDFVTNSSSTSYLFMFKAPPGTTLQDIHDQIKKTAEEILPLQVMHDGGDWERRLAWLRNEYNLVKALDDKDCTIWTLKACISDSYDFDGDYYFSNVMNKVFEDQKGWVVFEKNVES